MMGGRESSALSFIDMGPEPMRDKTSVAQLDSAEADASGARARSKKRGRHKDECAAEFGKVFGEFYKETRKNKKQRRKHHDDEPSLTIGNIIHFIIAVFFLWPIFIFIAAIWSLTDAVNFVRHTVEACISSTFWVGRLMKEWSAGMYLHKNSPKMLRYRGQRKAFGVEAKKDWQEAGVALMGIGRAWSRTFGLGGLFSSLERRIEKANEDWRRYVATTAYDNSEAPAEFPEDYEVVDELPRGGSSARLYVVRKKDDRNGQLYVLKYFNLRAGGNLESVVRESHAAQLAQKLGLIIESELGDNAFWYIMPYYHGETLTGGVMRNIKHARENNTVNEHYRISLGYVHQLLQIIAQYHEAGVFHKDIKPDNLIINGERIYLVDIGLMTPLSSMAQLTTHGTEYFRDPEMVKLALEGREVRQVDAAKFDVYSIGAVLFFTLSGEFPTSGALSRLPREVPMAAQWVVNRAMTGMHQRYGDARAMLTDIDYLCWAASQGTLDQVKPADLPSFKGMPVPPHLQAAQAHDNTEYRERLEHAPGGYGQWYSAPAYAQARPRRSFLRVAGSVMIFLGGLLFLALILAGTLKNFKETRDQSMAQASVDETIAARLPEDAGELKPVYMDIESSLAGGVNTETVVYRDAIERVELVPKLVEGIDELGGEWELAILSDLRKHDIKKPGALFGQAQVVFFHVDPDAEDRALAEGIEREFALESARQKLNTATFSDAEIAKVRGVVTGISDRLALHRELGVKFAETGRVPPFIVTFTIEHENGQKQVHVRKIYPGREYRATVPFGSAGADREEIPATSDE